MRIFSYGIVTIISLMGVYIFKSLSLPIPWMLGPLVAVLISQFFIRKIELIWPVEFRNFGLVVVGVAIGQAFQFELFTGMGWMIVFMFVLNISITMVSVVLSLFIQKMGNVSIKTSLTSTVAGGLSQIVAFAEEEEDINLAVVTYFHVVRIISIVLLIPFIVSGHIVTDQETFGFSYQTLLPVLLLVTLAWVFALVGKKVKLPVPFFIGPVFFVMILQLVNVQTPEVPVWFLHIAQICIGAYIGLLLKPKMFKLGAKMLVLGIASALVLILATYLQGLLMIQLFHYSLATSFLSTAAGGLDQMSLLATAVGADVSVVSVFQMFRLLFVFILIIPLLKLTCVWIDRRSAKKHGNDVVVGKT